ncbi:hypothetical protein [Sphingomonas sp. ABOLF]|uniref:hypothetical protein n=1 Tax=Sphingomonas sp. ABOLF TaxID=1985879 RepID=UPI0013DF844E|nr:hypothetical protein [Sphingomonas sp. ABOLF]
MTPEFIEKEVNSRVEKLIIESVDRALRSYSDTGKMIEKAVEEALKVERLDLPSYGAIVTQMLRAQIEARVAPLVAGQLAADMDELLGLAPKEVKLSEIADQMREEHEGKGYGPVITVIVEHKDYGSTWLYLDEEAHHERRDKYLCKHSVLISKDGKISSARTSDRDVGKGWIGRAHGLEQKLRAYVACGTTIILDEDAVITSVGDY